MIKSITGNLDYVVVIIVAIILYRWLGKPLANKI